MIRLNRAVFEKYQAAKGWDDTELAEKMGLNRTQIWRVKEGRNEPGRNFIAGALKAFPEASFDELFVLEEMLRPRKINAEQKPKAG